MATINASTGADIIVPSNNGDTYRGLAGNDTYILSNAISGSVTIVDTAGANTIQLVDGLSVASSKFAADSAQLTLSNGAVITINGADKFTYDVGGNITSGDTGSSNTYAQLASAMGVPTLPTGSTISDGSSGTVSGSSVTSSASAYTLSADVNSVAEGGTITYTITANAAVSADTTFTYNVAGDTNGGTVDKAGSSDTDSLSDSVTMASGSSSVTFTVSASSDNTAEGMEGIKVSVFDSNNNVIGSQSALISNNAALETTVTNLTAAIDEVQGSAGRDVIGGAAGTNLLSANGTTIAPGDNIDGGAGNDTLKIAVSGTSTGATDVISAITMTNVETIEINNFETTEAQETDLDMSLMTGVTAIGLTSSSATGDTTFDNVPNLVDVNYASGYGELTVTYAAGVTAGAADAQTINLNIAKVDATVAAANSSLISIAGVENITINNIGIAASNLATLTATSAKSLKITGDAYTSIYGALGASLKTIDLTEATAGANLTVATTATLIVTGGPGADRINFDSSLNSAGADIFDGGAGQDTVAVDDPATLTPTAVAGLTNIEVLEIGTSSATAYDANRISGITTLRTTIADDTIGGIKAIFTDASSGVNVQIRGTEGVKVELDVNGTADVANVTLATATGLGVIVGTDDGVNLAEFETVNITTGATASSFGVYTGTETQTINVSGVGGFTLGNSSATALMTVDASGLVGTGGLTMGTNAGLYVYPQTITGSKNIDTLIGGGAADTIKGGAGNDIISGGAYPDTIHGEAGNDIIDGEGGIDILSGGAGNDTFSVADDADFVTLASAEQVDGGAGTDTLKFIEEAVTTISETDLYGLKSIEQIWIATTENTTITLDDTVFANNGITNLKIIDLAAAGTKSVDGTLTVTASALTAANSITVNMNTAANEDDSLVGGAGDDTFTYLSDTSAASGLEATDTVTGGKGNDTLALTVGSVDIGASGTNIVLTGVTGVETITITNTDADDAYITLTDGQFVTSSLASTSGNGTTAAIVGVVDGTNSTGAGVIVLDASAEDDSKMIITGGAGADTLTGGQKADTIIGGTGNDILNGEAGIDIISGGSGNDTLNLTDVSDFIGLTSVEVFDGGSGTDIVNFTEDAATTVAAADLGGLSSVERITFEGTGANSLTLSDSVYEANGSTTLNVRDIAATGAVTVDAAGVSAANSLTYTTALAADTIDTITGGAGDDTFTFYETAISATDVLSGGAGNDILAIYADGNLTALTTTSMTKFETLSLTQDGTARAFPITLTAGFFQGATGTVAASTVTGVVTLDGSAETLTAMTISTGVGADIVTGGSKADTIKTGTGADVITGGPGADIITGGSGADDIKYSNSNAAGATVESSGATPDVITDFLSGTDDIKVTVDYSSLTSAVTINAVSSTGVTSKTLAQDSLSGGRLQYVYNYTDGLLYINYNQDNLITTSDWTISVNQGATPKTTIADGDIDWTITGTTLADTIIIGGGTNIVSAGAGNDTVTATTGTADGVSTISGGDGTDILIAGSGADIINGDAGVDTMSAGTGAAVLSGGAGEDVMIGGTGAYTINGGDDADIITGSSGAGIINGDAAADIIIGGSGDETIDGGAAADVINGGTGINIISDSAAADVVTVSNGGIDAVDVTTGSDDVTVSAVTEFNSVRFTITDMTGTTHDTTVSATSQDHVTGFSTTADDIKITGAVKTLTDTNKGAIIAVLNSDGGNADLDSSGVLIANTAQKSAVAFTGFGDFSVVAAELNTAIGTATAAQANDLHLLVMADSTANVHGVWAWKDVDGNGAINLGDEFGLMMTIVADGPLVVVDFDVA